MAFSGNNNDWIHGNHGLDRIFAKGGNDTIRGGHGHDEIFAGTGSDWIWGGIGKNTIAAGGDTDKDKIFVPVDQVQNENGNPGGVNADMLYDIDHRDRIFIHGEGIPDDSLSFALTSHNGVDGMGIYANGTLEALVVQTYIPSFVDSITSGGFLPER